IPFSTVGRRQVSNVPAQALILLNDPFVHQQAEEWAKRMCASEKLPFVRLTTMYETAFGRLPTIEELHACNDFLKAQAARYGMSENDVKVWKDLAHTLFNMKDFIYLN